MTTRRVLSVVGARPNFVKTAPVIVELARRGSEFEQLLVHTGQHYDLEMSDVFFSQLGISEPDYSLGVGSGSHAEQTARVMERLEPVLLAVQPDVMLVPGDVNSTLASALVGAKLGIPIGHIEAGLRSFDRSMPEEVNRVVADSLSSLLFTHSPEARENLVREGCDEGRIHHVGNTMVDTLVAMRPTIDAADAPGQLDLEPGTYLVVTLHRPALVDGPLLLEALRALERISHQLPVVFPAHPRTAAAMKASGVEMDWGRLRLLQPLSYVTFVSLLAEAGGVLTDSGGVQEETTFLGVPCFTLRDSTERPVTCSLGTNELLGLAPSRILELPERIAAAADLEAVVPTGWDGLAARRLVEVLARTMDTFEWARSATAAMS